MSDEMFVGRIPLPRTDLTGTFTFSMPREVTEEQWQFVQKVLRKMKPALVKPVEKEVPVETPNHQNGESNA